MKSTLKSPLLLLLSMCLIGASASFIENIFSLQSLFGLKDDKFDLSAPKVPYEVDAMDEKFLLEASKITGIALSDLDSCQQRVVLRLKTSCNKLNDEQVAKLAVMLLNCQSKVEGREIYPCTDTMSLKECTTSMDADVWNTYHLMTNRARAVCYSIRQMQFRAQTEIAVNRLVDAAQEQLSVMQKLAEGQNKMSETTSNLMGAVETGHEHLTEQQRNLEKAQFHSQLLVEENFNRLAKERKLVMETHHFLTDLTKEVKTRLENAAKQLNDQTKEQKTNHAEILEDLMQIHKQTQNIFDKIENSTRLLLEQSLLVSMQYNSTFKQLLQMNETVHSLVHMMNGTRKALEEKLGWLTEAFGGADYSIEKMLLIVSHMICLLVYMLACAFLQIPVGPRFFVLAIVPMNLLLGLNYGSDYAFGLGGLTITIIFAITVQRLATELLLRYKRPPERVQYERTTNECLNNNDPDVSADSTQADDDNFETFSNISRYRSRSNTPNVVNGSARPVCKANTRLGSQCKLVASPGREFCYKHITGSSVIL